MVSMSTHSVNLQAPVPTPAAQVPNTEAEVGDGKSLLAEQALKVRNSSFDLVYWQAS